MIWTPSNTWFLRLTSLHLDILIGSAVFAQLMLMPNTQTHRPRYMQHLCAGKDEDKQDQKHNAVITTHTLITEIA